jgi:carbonic anhydrase
LIQRIAKFKVKMESEAAENNVKLLQNYETLTISGVANLNVAAMKVLKLPPLQWINYDQAPQRIRMTNTGHTLILTAKYNEGQPYICGGPIPGDGPKYVFSQVNFIWGESALHGSEHTVDGNHLPMEMHVVHMNENYSNLEDAAQNPDGVIQLVYFFQIKSNTNPIVQSFMQHLKAIQIPDATMYLDDNDPYLLNKLIYSFTNDYYLYWSHYQTKVCSHVTLNLITREISYISIEQLKLFHQLLDKRMCPIMKNCDDKIREGSSANGEEVKDKGKVFHVNPLQPFTNTTLWPASIRTEPESRFEWCGVDGDAMSDNFSKFNNRRNKL